tara:strand:- start:1661 stop:1840 length:180 start_codon:yes stop_codon:yes gene_type:complete
MVTIEMDIIPGLIPEGDRMSVAITLIQRLKKEYDIKDEHLEGLETILFDVARFGYEGDK